MADEYVSKEQFEEFGKRMEQGFAHVHQRLDEQHQNFSAIHADIRQARSWLLQIFILVVFGLVIFGFMGGIALMLFRDLLSR